MRKERSWSDISHLAKNVDDNLLRLSHTSDKQKHSRLSGSGKNSMTSHYELEILSLDLLIENFHKIILSRETIFGFISKFNDLKSCRH